MRFMMLVIPKGYEKAGADFAPPADLVAKMTKYNDSLTKAGVLLGRSEEHTSELQSRPHLVCRLLLEKKKKTVHLYWNRLGSVGGVLAPASYRVSRDEANGIQS